MYHPSATPFSGLSHEAQDHTFQPNILRFPPTAVFISSRIIFPFIWNHFPLTSCIPDDLGKPYSTPWQIHPAMDEFANLPSSLFPLPYPSYLPEFRTHSPPQWGWHSPAQTSVVLLKCSCKNQSQEAPAPPYHWPSEQKKSRKKKSGQLDRDTEHTSRHYSSGMGSIFATEGDFPNPAASWDLLSDSHAEIIAICTIIMWLAWFWGPKPQLTAGKKGEGEEGRELGSTQRNQCKLTTSPHLIFGNYWTSCPLCLWLSETVTTYKLGWGAPMRINAQVQQAGPGQSAPRMLFPFLFYTERQHPTILSTESLINFGKPC